MSRVLVVADDFDFRQRLISMLLPQYQEMLPEGVDSRAAIERTRLLKPSIVIVRAELRNRDGLDLAAEIAHFQESAIIIVATNGMAAPRAFEIGVIDYVLAPVRLERLTKAMRRALELTAVAPASGLKPARASSAPLNAKLRVKSRSGFIFLDYAELIWVEAEGNYVKLHCIDVEYQVREPLSEFLARVDGHGFMRIHRSVVVNSTWIREIRSGGAGNYVLVLQNSARLPISRPYHDVVEQWMKSVGSLDAGNLADVDL